MKGGQKLQIREIIYLTKQGWKLRRITTCCNGIILTLSRSSIAFYPAIHNFNIDVSIIAIKQNEKPRMRYIFSFPERLAEGLVCVNSLDAKDFTKLCDSLRESKYAFGTSALATMVYESFKQISLSDLEKVITGVAWLIFPKENEGISYELVINDLIELSKEEGKIKELRFDSEMQVEEFKRRLLALLSIPQVYYARKASDVFFEHENLFSSATITTDMRPIFNPELKETTQMGVLSASLNINYRDALGEYRDICLAIDRGDIKKLKRILENAENQIRGLEAIFEKSNITEIKNRE